MKKILGLVLGVLVVSSLMVVVPEYLFSQQQVNPELIEQTEEVSQSKAIFYGKYMPVPEIPQMDRSLKVLGATNGEKRIEVDLTNQRLYAYEDDKKVYDFLISSGKWGRTPVGEFTIWYKVESTRMRGGSKELRTYYDLPKVPYTMFFYNQNIVKSRGYGIHGAYWHNNFGHPMSHGCINMKPEEAGILYQWASPVVPEKKKSTSATKDNPGTKVVIYGKAPMS